MDMVAGGGKQADRNAVAAKGRRHMSGIKAGEFVPLGVRLGGCSLFITYLYIKEHKNAQAPSSLFVAGLPLEMSKRTLEQVVSCFGDPMQTVIHANKASHSTPCS